MAKLTPKYSVGLLVQSSQAGVWFQGKQVPYEAMKITGYAEKNGELIVLLEVRYSAKVVADSQGTIRPLETLWAPESEVHP